MVNRLARLVIATGEPTDIGPSLALSLAITPLAADLIAASDTRLLHALAQRQQYAVQLRPFDDKPVRMRAAGHLQVLDIPCRVMPNDAAPDPRNTFHALATLARAMDGCLTRTFDALITAPIDASSIRTAGEVHTSIMTLLAERIGHMTLTAETVRDTDYIFACNPPDHLQQPVPIDADNLYNCIECLLMQQPQLLAFAVIVPTAIAADSHARVEDVLAAYRARGLEPMLLQTDTLQEAQAQLPHMSAALVLAHEPRQPLDPDWDVRCCKTLGLPFPHYHISGNARALAEHAGWLQHRFMQLLQSVETREADHDAG